MHAKWTGFKYIYIYIYIYGIYRGISENLVKISFNLISFFLILPNFGRMKIWGFEGIGKN